MESLSPINISMRYEWELTIEYESMKKKINRSFWPRAHYKRAHLLTIHEYQIHAGVSWTVKSTAVSLTYLILD